MTHTPNARYCLPARYRRRPQPAYFVDALDGMICQPDVYPAAAALARTLGARTIIDVGCGSGDKLAELHPELQIVGLDFGENLAECRRRHPHGIWVEHDLEAEEAPPIPPGIADGAVVICADVIEHMVSPERLLATLSRLLEDAAAVVISTPERELVRGAGHSGPPDNPCHTMEWALREFEDLMASHGLVHGTCGLTRSNDVENVWKTIVGVYFRDAEARGRGEAAWGWERTSETGSPVLPVRTAARIVRRVCLLTREYCEDVPLGGIGRAMQMQARSLAAAGVDVHVVTLAAGDEASSYHDGEVQVHRVPEPRIGGQVTDMHYLQPALWSHAVSTAYADLDARFTFDVVEAPDYFAEALHLPLRPETPLVISLHGLSALLLAEGADRAPSPGDRAFCALELAALGRATTLSAPTAMVRDRTLALLGNDAPPSAVVPLAFDSARFPARARRAMHEGPLRLIHVGRLQHLKGADLAIRAAATVARRGIAVELLLVGADVAGYRSEVLEPLLSELGFDGARFLGRRDAVEVAELLRESDCAVLPSRFENFHMAAVESLASGVPVVGTDAVGLACWFGPDEGFRTVPLGEPERVAEAIADAVLDSGWRQRAAARGPEAVRERLAPAVIAERQLALYETASRARAQSAAVEQETALRAAGRRRERADAPADLELDARGRVTVATAAELLRRPHLLRAYAGETRLEDDATLVVLTPGVPEDVAGPLQNALDEAGWDEDGHDVLLHGPSRDGGAALAVRAVAVLGAGIGLQGLASLPRMARDND
jgi:glycosyltransferase involved in cell wall biosynthesis